MNVARLADGYPLCIVSPQGDSVRHLLRQLWTDESGQGLPEYALLVAAVVVMVVTASVLLSEPINDLFSNINEYIGENNELAT